MAGNPHPVFQDGVPVEKANARAYLPLRLGNPDALRNIDGSTFWLCYIQTLLAFFYRDTSDTTSEDNGASVIADANGGIWKIVSGNAGLSIAAAGPLASRGAFDGEDPGFTYFGTDTELLYVRLNAGGWSAGSEIVGPEGPTSTVPGPPNELSVGTVTEGPADASITGSYPDQKLNLSIPKGDPGAQGNPFSPDEVVPDLAGRAAFDGEDKNFAVLVEADSSNDDLPTLYFKLSAASGDWSDGFTFEGGGGEGIPTGGTAGQVLAKIDGADYNTEWTDPAGDPATAIHAAASKTAPDDADEFGFLDSASSWVLKKFTWANLKAALAAWLVSAGWIREKLTADRTYYVDTTNGNDSNNGLAAGSGNAFKTIQKAIDTVAGLDLSIYNVTIQVGAGTYTGGVIVNGPWIGAGTVTLVGDVTTPSNVVISTTSADAIKLQNGASLAIGGFKLQTTTSGCGILSTSGAAASVVGKMEYGACDTAHLRADGAGSNILVTSAYAISGGSRAHYRAEIGSSITASNVGTITISGTPNFSFGFVYDEFSYVRAFGNTYSGSATGPRYSVNANGVIQTAGAGENYFPGNSNGTKASGGQYL